MAVDATGYPKASQSPALQFTIELGESATSIPNKVNIVCTGNNQGRAHLLRSDEKRWGSHLDREEVFLDRPIGSLPSWREDGQCRCSSLYHLFQFEGQLYMIVPIALLVVP